MLNLALMPKPVTQLGKRSILTGAQVRDPQSILEAFPNPHPGRDYGVEFVFPEFTSVCPVTGQPDFATITVQYVPDRYCVEMKSLKLYFFAFRDQGVFFESIVNTILDDLVAVLAPRRMKVIGTFNVRGGMGATVTAEHDGRPGAGKPSIRRAANGRRAKPVEGL